MPLCSFLLVICHVLQRVERTSSWLLSLYTHPAELVVTLLEGGRAQFLVNNCRLLPSSCTFSCPFRLVACTGTNKKVSGNRNGTSFLKCVTSLAIKSLTLRSRSQKRKRNKLIGEKLVEMWVSARGGKRGSNSSSSTSSSRSRGGGGVSCRSNRSRKGHKSGISFSYLAAAADRTAAAAAAASVAASGFFCRVEFLHVCTCTNSLNVLSF